MFLMEEYGAVSTKQAIGNIKFGFNRISNAATSKETYIFFNSIDNLKYLCLFISEISILRTYLIIQYIYNPNMLNPVILVFIFYDCFYIRQCHIQQKIARLAIFKLLQHYQPIWEWRSTFLT